MSKRKYHVGHLVPERSFFTSSIRINFIRWIFGMYDVNQKLGVLEFVDNRTQGTLFSIIKKYIAVGWSFIRIPQPCMWTMLNSRVTSSIFRQFLCPHTNMRGSTIPNTLWIRSRVRAQTTWRVFGKMLKIKQDVWNHSRIIPFLPRWGSMASNVWKENSGGF